MKRKDLITELRGLGVSQLKERRLKVGEELMKLRFRHASGQLEQSHRFTQLKREMARIKTLERQARA